MAAPTRQVMKDAEIKETVFQVLRRIAPEADLEALDPGAGLRQALDIDSFDFLNFIIGLHERLGVDIPESSYGQLASLADVIGYLSRRLAA